MRAPVQFVRDRLAERAAQWTLADHVRLWLILRARP